MPNEVREEAYNVMMTDLLNS